MDEFIPNGQNIAIRAIYKPTSDGFSLNTLAKILVSFYKVWA